MRLRGLAPRSGGNPGSAIGALESFASLHWETDLPFWNRLPPGWQWMRIVICLNAGRFAEHTGTGASRRDRPNLTAVRATDWR